MSLGEVIAELRTDRKMNQQKLANFLEVSRPTVSNYELGVHNPDIESLIKLADFFNVSVDYMLGRVRYKVDYKALDNYIVKSGAKTVTVGDLLMRINALSAKSKIALLEYAELLELKEKQQS